MPDALDIYEFPKGYAGRRVYVKVQGHDKLVASIYTYYGYDRRSYLHPDFGGDLSGVGARSDTVRAPMVIRDMSAYRSPIDGQMITSRSAHREHVKAHDVIEVGNDRVTPAPSNNVAETRAIGEQIKRRIEEVKALTESTYQEHIHQQRAEHEAVAALVTPAT